MENETALSLFQRKQVAKFFLIVFKNTFVIALLS